VQRRLHRPGLVSELDAQRLVGLGHSADLVEEIHVPRAAAELAVGDAFEANLLLDPRDIANRCVLDTAQFLEREAAGLMLGPRPQQLRWAQ